MNDINEIPTPPPEPPEPPESRFMSLEEVQAMQKDYGIETHSLGEWDGDSIPDKPYIETETTNVEPEFQFAEGFDENTFNQAFYEANPTADATDVFNHEEGSFQFAEGFDGDTMNQEINKAEGIANGLSDDFVDNKDLFDADTEDIGVKDRINYPNQETFGMVEGTEKTYNSLDDFKEEHDGEAIITRRGDRDGGTFGVGDISYEESSLAEEEDFFDETTCQYEIESLPDDCVIKTGEVAKWEEAGENREGGGEQLSFVKLDEEGKEIGSYSASDLEYEGHIKRI